MCLCFDFGLNLYRIIFDGERYMYLYAVGTIWPAAINPVQFDFKQTINRFWKSVVLGVLQVTQKCFSSLLLSQLQWTTCPRQKHSCSCRAPTTEPVTNICQWTTNDGMSPLIPSGEWATVGVGGGWGCVWFDKFVEEELSLWHTIMKYIRAFHYCMYCVSDSSSSTNLSNRTPPHSRPFPRRDKRQLNEIHGIFSISFLGAR